MIHPLLLLLPFLLSSIAASSSSPTCLDDNGTPVDWWVALLVGSNSPNYYIYTSATPALSLSPHSLDQTTTGAIMSTLAQLYASPAATAHAMWNDEPPGGSASSSYAHSKGVMLLSDAASSDAAGFHLVHSKPNWPLPKSDGLTVPPDFDYGQSFLCVAVDSANFETIAAAQSVNYPYVYDFNVPSPSALPNLAGLTAKTKSGEDTAASVVTSTGGAKVTVFAKSKAWGKDLYQDLVAPTLADSIYVETWRDGSGGKLPSFCKGNDPDVPDHSSEYDVLFVNNVTMPDGATWLGTKDHSKWAVANEEGAACFGDINNMCSQESRGGGTVCVHDAGIAKAMKEAVAGTDGCWDYDVCSTTYQCYWCADEAQEAATEVTAADTLCTCTTSPCPVAGLNKLEIGSGTVGEYTYDMTTAEPSLPVVSSVKVKLLPTDLDHGSGTTSCTTSYARAMESDGLENVDAGHILAHHLGGPGNAPINIFPQALHYNRGSYAKFEEAIYDCMAAATAADIEWSFSYNDTLCTQPQSVLYSVKYEGGDCDDVEEEFPNTYYN